MRLRKLLTISPGLYLLAWLTTVAPAEIEENPFVEAINLVATTQRSTIRSIDKGDWLTDSAKREWIVQRPFGPGIIDSTHLLQVTYVVDGKQLAAWLVDLKSKKAQKQ